MSRSWSPIYIGDKISFWHIIYHNQLLICLVLCRIYETPLKLVTETVSLYFNAFMHCQFEGEIYHLVKWDTKSTDSLLQ